MNDVKISIYDSIVQVLPNATKAVQNFNGDQFAEKILSKKEADEDSSSDADSPEARKLALYIGEALSSEAEKLSRYIDKDHIPEHLNKIRACNNATDLAQVVVSLLDQEPKLTEETIVKENFIQCLLPFAINITTGRSVNNIRARINDALIARRKSHPKH